MIPSLTDDEITFFDTHGYLVLRDVLEAADVAALVDAGDELIASDMPFFRDVEDGASGYRHLVELDDRFTSLIAQPRVLAAMCRILGPELHLSSSHLSYLDPQPNRRAWTSRWHTDIHGLERDLGPRALVRVGLKAGFCLTDQLGADTGMTMLLPGSHVVRPDPLPENGSDTPHGAVQPSLRAGDCLLFENRTLHTTGPNLTRRVRKSVFIGYTFRWVVPLEELSDPDRLRAHPDPNVADLVPRAYRVPGNGALQRICDEVKRP